jgi:hypothetical protein
VNYDVSVSLSKVASNCNFSLFVTVAFGFATAAVLLTVFVLVLLSIYSLHWCTRKRRRDDYERVN